MPPYDNLPLSVEKRVTRFFQEAGDRVYQRREIEKACRENQAAWNLPPNTLPRHVFDLLIDRKVIRAVRLVPNSAEHKPRTLYLCGTPTVFSVALSLSRGGYHSHGTAVFLHQLSDQLPATVFVNREQTPKPSRPGSLTQEGIHRAFKVPQRRSLYAFRYEDFQICLLSGKHTGRLEVVPVEYGRKEVLQVTGVERTLVDIAVRPDYAGGVYQVLAAYRGARESVSLNKLFAILKQLVYVYPYHQAIGFYLERAGYPAEKIEPFRKIGLNFDFYVAHGLREPEYNKSWRIFYPKGF